MVVVVVVVSHNCARAREARAAREAWGGFFGGGLAWGVNFLGSLKKKGLLSVKRSFFFFWLKEVLVLFLCGI